MVDLVWINEVTETSEVITTAATEEEAITILHAIWRMNKVSAQNETRERQADGSLSISYGHPHFKYQICASET